MTIERIRPLPDAATLAAMYAAPHDHRVYGHGHHMRVELTIALAALHMTPEAPSSIIDLSCGNGAIATRLAQTFNAGLLLGDYAPGHALTGPIEATIAAVDGGDLFVMCETLEHLDDPVAVLDEVRKRFNRILLSTPIDNFGDANGEHLWSWDREGVETMLVEAGFVPRVFTCLDTRLFGEPYNYGTWMAY